MRRGSMPWREHGLCLRQSLPLRLRGPGMTARPDLSTCDREPIHVPGAIQPHGILLVTDPNGARIDHAAGDIEGQLGLPNWLGAPLSEVLGPGVANEVARSGTNGA